MQRKSGITLVEVLIVVAIVLILAGIVFSMTSGARVNARRTSCVSTMKQLYMALSMYADDSDATSLYPELHGHTYFDAFYLPVLKPYGITDSQKYCPSTPSRYKEKLYSTYQFAGLGLGTQGDVPGKFDRVKRNKELEVLLGSDMPIVRCPVHDEIEYQPREGKKGEPWMIWINSVGGLKKGRINWALRDNYGDALGF